MRFFKKEFCVEDDPEGVASDWKGDDIDENGPPPPHEPRLEVVSAEPREEGIAPSGITVGTAVAEPVVAEVEASPAVGERSGEESAQAENNPQKRPKKDRPEIRVEFVPRAAGEPPYKDTKCQRSGSFRTSSSCIRGKNDTDDVGTVCNSSWCWNGVCSGCGNQHTSAGSRRSHLSNRTGSEVSSAGIEMRIMLLPRAEADGILDAPPCEDKVARVVSAPFTERQNAKADPNALTSLDCQRKKLQFIHTHHSICAPRDHALQTTTPQRLPQRSRDLSAQE